MITCAHVQIVPPSAIRWLVCVLAVGALTTAAPLAAFVPPERPASTAGLAVATPELYIAPAMATLDELDPALGSALATDLAILGVPPEMAYFDRRGGTWGTLVPTVPLIPGHGVGNHLDWALLGIASPEDEAALRAAAEQAFRGFLTASAVALRLDPAEVGKMHLAVHDGGRVIQIHAPRQVAGVPVRDSSLTAVVNSGNLVLFGTQNWGPVGWPPAPSIGPGQAEAVVASHVAPHTVGRFWRDTEMALVPTAHVADPASVATGDGYRYRLAWVVSPTLEGDAGSWEGLVDASNGELLKLADLNPHLTRRTVGGIYPVSNDGLSPGGVPDGVTQPGHPMPFADLRLADGTVVTTNSAGLADFQGPFSTALSGPFVQMVDNCGRVEEATSCRDLDLATSGGTDCTVPAGRSAGNTHSSRTGFYEVNRIVEQAKGWVRGIDRTNLWLESQITANMNIPNTCNAFFSLTGGTINFYQEGPSASGAVICRNTGEIAAVFDHEWGHGLDFNDNVPGISVPGEAYADMAAVVRLNTSCIGRGFFKSLGDGTRLDELYCGGDGDPCTECTGVREIDWAKRASGQPHDIDWILAQNPAAPGGCRASLTTVPEPHGLGTGPCGFGTHCEGNVVSEAFWDFMKRDLPCHPHAYDPATDSCTGPGSIDENTALEITTRLFYLGATNVNRWYQCNPFAPPGVNRWGGCLADSGYFQFLAMDDDNGTLVDGTPHGGALFDAFDRHQLACPVPLPASADLCTAPAEAPVVTAVPTVHGAEVSWGAVPGASKYWVFRTEGVHGCSFGKERIAEVTGTSFSDSGLLDGFEYFYSVIPVGSVAGLANDACIGTMSACAAVVPLGTEESTGPLLTIDGIADGLTIQTGDGDPFLDNCEQAELAFAVRNEGGTSLTEVTLTAVRPISHPEIQILTPLPAPIAEVLEVGCGLAAAEAVGSLALLAAGLEHGDTVEIEVEIDAAELAAPVTGRLFIHDVQSDWMLADVLFDFEDGSQGWQVMQGTFGRTSLPPPGAELSTWYLASSALEPDRCDQVRSPAVRLTESSTLSLYSQFDIEPEIAFSFYDRANVGLVDPETGERMLISPDGGMRPYNVPQGAENGSCVTTNQAGWNGPGPGWLDATWSSAALGVTALGPEGRELQIDVAYGTDPLIQGLGFWFDQVRVTHVLVPGPDAGAGECPAPPPECQELDDADPAIEYRRGWHRQQNPEATGGGYHRRLGSPGGGEPPRARLVFEGDEVTYLYATSEIGGTADIYIDGVLIETLSYGGGGQGKDEPTFGARRTYVGLGPGSHELVIEHRSGAVYVDGFEVGCQGGSGADASAPEARSETWTDNASSSEGLVIVRQVEVGALDEEVSVVVEGALVPLTVSLLDPAGNLIGSGGALISGLTASGLDAPVTSEGTYTVRVVGTLGAFRALRLSVARTVAVE